MNRTVEPSFFQSLWPHAARLLVGGVFIYAGCVKILDPFAFAKSIYQYQLLPDLWINVAAILLPWLEVISGTALILVPKLRHGASGWIALLLLVFTMAILLSMYRGLDISCGCFSTDPNASRIGWTKVAENTGMLLLSILAFVQAGRHPSLQRD